MYGGKGTRPNAFQQSERLFVALRQRNPTAVGLFDGQLQADVFLPLCVRQANPFVRRQLSAGLAEDSPNTTLPSLQEQALPMPARTLPATEQPGGDDLRIVQTQGNHPE